MDTTRQLTPAPGANPYVGPRPFQREERDRFFGREREARDLLSLIVSERLVVFHAESGTGKTSLINTQIVPALEAQGFEVLPPARLSGASAEAEGGNIFATNLMLNLETATGRADQCKPLRLAEFLANLHWDGRAFVYQPAPSPAPEDSQADPEEVWVKPRALIIDQFEELFNTHLEAWKKRADLFEQLAEAMRQNPRLWVVLAMREDYIAELDPYAHLVPGGLRTRYYMQRMRAKGALDAITKPAAKGGRPFAPGAAQMLVYNLSCVQQAVDAQGQPRYVEGEAIEPFQLQVVCRQLWDYLRSRPGDTITLADLAHLSGDSQAANDTRRLNLIDRALRDFYESALAQAVATRANERQLRRWFAERLITPQGTRGLTAETDGLPDAAVSALENRHLIRGELRGDRKWYELTHDRLINPVRSSNTEWFANKLSLLQKQAEVWGKQGRSKGLLLRDKELKEAEAWADQHKGELSPLEFKFVQECRTARGEQRRFAALTIAVFAAAVVAFALAGIAAYLGLQADNARKEADHNARLALARAFIAASVDSQGLDPERSLLLGLEATYMTRASGVLPEAESALLRAMQAARLQRTLPLVPSDALRVVFNADETTVVAVNYTQVVISATTGTPLSQTLQLSDAGIENGYFFGVALSSDGKLLAVGSGGYLQNTGVLQLWRLENGGKPTLLNQKAVSCEAACLVGAVSISPDGKRLAGAESNTARAFIWDIADDTVVTLAGHTAPIQATAFSADGQRLATASDDKTARVWDATTGEALFTLAGHADALYAVAFSPDGTRVATGSMDSTASVWDISQPRQGRELFSLIGHTNTVFDVKFDPTGQYLATASADGTAKVWTLAPRLRSNRELFTLPGHTQPVNTIAFSPDGQHLATTSWDGTIKFWEARIGHAEAVTLLTFSADGKQLKTWGDDAEAMLWEAASGRKLAANRISATGFNGAAFSHDGRQVAISIDQRVSVWEIETGQFQNELKAPETLGALAFSPDRRHVAAAAGATGQDGTYRIYQWDTLTGDRIDWQTRLIGRIFNLTYSPDGTFLAIATQDGVVEIWNMTSSPVKELAGPPQSDGMIFGLAFSPDSQRLAVADSKGRFGLWNPAQAAWEWKLYTGHADWIYQVVFSADGAYLATAGKDRVAKIWRADTAGPALYTFPYPGEVRSVAFSPDRKSLAVGGTDRNAYIFPLDATELIEPACARLTRNLTKDEWKQFWPVEWYRPTCPELP